ncbi:hypothetical protein ACHAXS_003620 [Conticribra weissflogii]
MIRRRESSGDIISLPLFKGNGLNQRRRIGTHVSSNQSDRQDAVVILRIVVVVIISLCLVWFYSIIQVATSIGDIRGGSELVTRPQFDNLRLSRSWWIRERIKKLRTRLQPAAPLLNPSQMESPLLIMTCERAEYLERTLWKVFEYHPAQQLQKSPSDFRHQRAIGSPIIISQDGGNEAVEAVIESYRNLFEKELGVPLYRIEHIPPKSLLEKPENVDQWDWEDHAWERPYKLLAAHYGWAIEQIFSGKVYFNDNQMDHNRRIPKPPMAKRVIILEEDIEIARDFFSYMNATADLLDSDSTLFAVSAFNDNGKEQLVADPKRLLRSDFFPGLGWMMPRHVWDGPIHHPHAGLKREWAPGGFWDDWIREPNIRRGRQVIRPEISRTFHFGNVKGASSGEQTLKLSEIRLDSVNVNWVEMNLSYLEPLNFAENYWNRVSSARLVRSNEEAKSFVAHSDVKMTYSDWNQFKYIAKSLGIAEDEKAGVPRTAYEGIVEVRYGGGDFFIFLTPPYVDRGIKPADFGRKAWMKINKETLLEKFGVTENDGFLFGNDITDSENI